MSERRRGCSALAQRTSRPASAVPRIRSREMESASDRHESQAAAGATQVPQSENLGTVVSGMRSASRSTHPPSAATTAVATTARPGTASSRAISRPCSAVSGQASTSSQLSAASRRFSANHAQDKAIKGALQYQHRRASSARARKTVRHPFASVTWDENPSPPVAEYAQENARRLARALDFDDDAMQKPLSTETIRISHIYGDALVPRSFRSIF